MSEIYDAIVVGGGGAGSMAADYLSSNKFKTLVIDKGGGFLSKLSKAPFLPCFTGNIIQDMHGQIESRGGKIKNLAADGVDFKTQTRKVICGAETFEANSIILAMGSAERTGYLAGEEALIGKGVFYDASPFAGFVGGQAVAVIGKTRTALEEAILLSKFVDSLYFVIPSNKLEGDTRLINQIQHDKKVELLFSTSLKTINGTNEVKSITVFTGGNEKEINVRAVFSYMHDFQPKNQILKDIVELSPSGEVLVNEQFSTSVPGVFACGDILCAKHQFPAISLAQGLLTGINAAQYLTKR